MQCEDGTSVFLKTRKNTTMGAIYIIVVMTCRNTGVGCSPHLDEMGEETNPHIGIAPQFTKNAAYGNLCIGHYKKQAQMS